MIFPWKSLFIVDVCTPNIPPAPLVVEEQVQHQHRPLLCNCLHSNDFHVCSLNLQGSIFKQTVNGTCQKENKLVKQSWVWLRQSVNFTGRGCMCWVGLLSPTEALYEVQINPMTNKLPPASGPFSLISSMNSSKSLRIGSCWIGQWLQFTSDPIQLNLPKTQCK